VTAGRWNLSHHKPKSLLFSSAKAKSRLTVLLPRRSCCRCCCFLRMDYNQFSATLEYWHAVGGAGPG